MQFSTFSHKRNDFRGGGEVTEPKMGVLIFSTFLSEKFLMITRNDRNMIKMYIGLHVKYPLFLSDFNETCIFSTQIFEKSSNIKLHENPSSGSRVVPCEQTDKQI